VTINGQGHDSEISEAQYLGNRARYWGGVNGPPIGNHPLRMLWLAMTYGHVTYDVTWPNMW